jgi:phytoene synthase
LLLTETFLESKRGQVQSFAVTHQGPHPSSDETKIFFVLGNPPHGPIHRAGEKTLGSITWYLIVVTTANEIANSYRFARSLMGRSGSTFSLGLGLLPREQADAMHALYAFCRMTDDIADGEGTPDDKRLRLADWNRQLDESLLGQQHESIWPALTDTVGKFGINPQHLRDQIAGNQRDIDCQPIRDISDLEVYMDLVAGSVGFACLAIWGCRKPAAIEPARAAGRALQLTNILRDLHEDRQRGRVYLPADELARFDCPSHRWASRDAHFQGLMAFQVERARGYFESSSRLMPMLARPARRVFAIFQGRYRAILDEIVRRGFDVFSARVRVSRLRTLGIIAKSLVS